MNKVEKTERLEQLREILKPGDTVYTSLRHVSRSGMMRVLRLTLIRDNEPRDITYLVAPLIEGYNERHGGAKISGCGMDMGFEMVYVLSRLLFPEGFGEPCVECSQRPAHRDGAHYASNPANAAAEAMHGNDDHLCKFRGRNGDPSGWDNDGGYALNQRWL